ncbi:MAG: trypsin-like peptidase domain-containing protein [Pirellulaceae bacterium]
MVRQSCGGGRVTPSAACLLAFLAAIACSHPLHASALRRTAIVRAVENARDSIVNIHGRKTVRSGEQFAPTDSYRQVNGMGTGVVIDERGYIITNYHVIEGVARIQVTLSDERTVIAQMVDHDPRTDLAIIRIPTDDPLPVIHIGTSSDLMTGEPVIAVGNAFGYEHTVTRGIISALHRTVQVSDDQKYHHLIQTDASINPGNSGGPLLNIDGEMIGINVAVRVGAQGIGFAIPIDEALAVAARMMSVERRERLTHGVIGETQIVDAKSRYSVASIEQESPAAKAGLQSGDVVVSVGEVPVNRSLDFERALLGRKPGEEVAVTVQRGGAPMRLSLVMTAASPQTVAASDPQWDTLGMRLAPITTETFARYNSRYRGGLKVVEVRPDGPAALQGIRRGDVLVGMHHWETISLDNIDYIMRHAEFATLQPIKFYILRGNETLYGHMHASMPARR